MSELIVSLTCGDLGAQVRVPLRADGASPFAIADAMGACAEGFDRLWATAGAFALEDDDEADEAEATYGTDAADG